MFSKRITPYFCHWANRYDHTVGHCGYIGPQRVSAAVRSHFNTADPLKILDMAGGTGLAAEQIRRTFPNAHITGADYSREMLEIGKNKKRFDLIVQQDLSTAPFEFEDNSFDVVISSGAMEFIGNPEHAIAEMARITKPGGLVASTFMVDDINYRISTIASVCWNAVATLTSSSKMVRQPLCVAEKPKKIERLFQKNALNVSRKQIFTGYRQIPILSEPIYYLFAGIKQPAPV